MRVFKLVTVAALLLLGTTAAFAYSGIGFSGALCSADPMEGLSNPQHTGIWGSGPAFIFCQISYPPNTTQSFSYNSIQVEITDKTSQGTNWCRPGNFTTSGGVEFFGPTKYTCSQWGGCPDATTSYVGEAALYWNATESFLGMSSDGLNQVWDFSTTELFCQASNMYIGAYRFMTW